MSRALLFVAALIATAFAPLCARAQTIETAARHAILIDYDTGAVLFAKDADLPMPPASMSKLMTLTLLFEQLKDKRVKLDDKFPVSEHAWRTGGAGTEGSTMFAELGSSIRVEDLIRGIIVQSGNDACIVVAEALAGTEAAFAENMNARAKELGLKQSHFVDATGLPDPEQYMSAHDIARLARHLVRDLGDYYHYFAETEFTWNDIHQLNRNRLLFLNMGVDGLKTGHVSASGYGMVASALRNGQRLILVVNGLNSEKQRADESRRLLELGFRNFKPYALFSAGAEVDKAPVFNGKADSVSLVVKDPVKVIMMRASRPDMKVTVHYKAPLVAPVAAGTKVGTLTVDAPGAVPVTVPVYTAVAVKHVGPFGQIVNAAIHLIRGSMADE